VIEEIEQKTGDPKVFWHQESQRWIMILFAKVGSYKLLGSSNLTDWTELGTLNFPGAGERPDLFELPVDEDTENTRWVVSEGRGNYMIGRFDGKSFVPETDVLRSERGTNFYGRQTWNGVSSQRQVSISWLRGSAREYTEMPFSQQFSIPRELTLATTPSGLRMFQRPVEELKQLRINPISWTNTTLEVGVNPLRMAKGNCFDIELEMMPDEADFIILTIGRSRIEFDCKEGTLSFGNKSVDIEVPNGRLQMRILIDRISTEVFASHGRYVLSHVVDNDAELAPLQLRASGGPAHIHALNVWNLESIWPHR
jgi:sucrose-6-phosphate hydrolase SacC (GH32 family)